MWQISEQNRKKNSPSLQADYTPVWKNDKL